MEKKNSKLGLLVICVLLVGVIAAGTIVYPMLTAQVEQESAPAPQGTQSEAPAVTLQPAQADEAPKAEATKKPAEVAGPVMKNMAANFTSYDDAGNPVTLKDMRGKPTVVNFFASWCGPCKMEMPYFEELYLEYGDQVNFMMVNLCAFGNDTKENGKAMVAEGGWTFPVYFDSDGDAALKYSIRSMPTTIFVSADGELKGRHTGMIPESTLRQTVEAMIEAAE